MSVLVERPRLTVPVTERDHVLGPATAPVTLVEYGDYECPFCGAAHASVAQVRQVMGNDLRFVFRHFPLSQIHPHAYQAAEAAEAAGAQSRFWEMHDLLFENQDRLGLRDLIGYAGALGLDLERFVTDLRGHAYAGRLREDFLSGVRSGVNGTPTFFVNGIRHDGGYDPEAFSTHFARRSDMARSRERLPRDLLQPLLRREELEALVRHYHHLQNERQRASPRELDEAAHRGEAPRRPRAIRPPARGVGSRGRALARVVGASAQPRAGAVLPAGHPTPPLLRRDGRGLRRRGSRHEGRGARGACGRCAHGAGRRGKDLSTATPPLSFRVDGITAHETFTASAEALDALADFLGDEGRPPPWDHASELLADGLIDTHFAVTPRGRRALASRHDQA